MLLILLTSACQQQNAQQFIFEESPKEVKEDIVEKVAIAAPEIPTVKIISPKDGDLIKSYNITVQVESLNFNIVAVGKPLKDNEGHFHIWLDSEQKVGPDKIVKFEKVVSGRYSIVAELVKSDHSSLSPRVISGITVNVQSDFVPKATQQEGIREYTVEADDNGFYPGKIISRIGDNVTIQFKFRDHLIYYAGLDIIGPFPDVKYRIGDKQPITRSFVMQQETVIKSFWPSSGIKKAELIVEIEKDNT